MVERLLIRGARIVSPVDGIDLISDLPIRNGVIAEIDEHLSAQGAEVTETGGLTAAPGLAGMHIHLCDPGSTQKEDAQSGCRAAAAGGVMSLLVMPNTNPVTDTPGVAWDIFARVEHADTHVYVAAAITTSLKSEVLTGVAALKAAGITAVPDDRRPATNTRLMAEGVKQATWLGLWVVSHCEGLCLATGGLMNKGETNRWLGVPSIPAAVEGCGTARDIAPAESYGVPIYICYVSTMTAVAMIHDAKRRGVQAAAETVPHYLSPTEQALLSKNGDRQMDPPLRTEYGLLAIREALHDDAFGVIAIDHALHTPAERADFLAASNGSISMETSPVVGITYLVNTGCLTPAQLIEKASVIPARILGIPGGTLKQDVPADIVLFSRSERWMVNPAKLHGKGRNTSFAGLELSGEVRYTVCCGSVVYREV